MASVALQRSLFELQARIRARPAKSEAAGSPLRPLEELPRGRGRGGFGPESRGAAGGALRPPGVARPVRVGARSAVGVSARLVGETVGQLPASAGRIYGVLHEVAVRVASARGYAAGVSQVSFHVPAEVVAHELGMHRATLYRHLPRLKALGLLDARAHRTTYNGQVVADGTIWSVKLIPSRGRSARVSYEDLRHKWRDLAWDVERGRTAYEHVRQSDTGERQQGAVGVLLGWALPQEDIQAPLGMTVARYGGVGLECVLDVPFASRAARGEAVDVAARSACALLGDDSVNFYRWLLWQLLRLHDRGQDHFEGVFVMLQRAVADQREGFARSAGALFVSRLKRWEVWELVRATPPWGVGARPQV